MRNFQSKLKSAGLLVACLLGANTSAAGAEADALVTAEMQAQIAPEIQVQLDQALILASTRPWDALALLEPLEARIASGELNYWETFEVWLLVGEARLSAKTYRTARTALENCLNFTDIDPYRRSLALDAAGKLYVQLKEADLALAVFNELNNMRGGRDPEMLILISQVHAQLLRDPDTALTYLEDAIRYETGVPKRSRYLQLRRAYVQGRDYTRALEVAKAMVDLFGEEDDLDAMDDILAKLPQQR